jgi:hypothetical protein
LAGRVAATGRVATAGRILTGVLRLNGRRNQESYRDDGRKPDGNRTARRSHLGFLPSEFYMVPGPKAVIKDAVEGFGVSGCKPGARLRGRRRDARFPSFPACECTQRSIPRAVRIQIGGGLTKRFAFFRRVTLDYRSHNVLIDF